MADLTTVLLAGTSICAFVIALLLLEAKKRDAAQQAQKQQQSLLSSTTRATLSATEASTAATATLTTALTAHTTLLASQLSAQEHLTASLTHVAGLLETRFAADSPSETISNTSDRTHARDQDADLYRRKVEAMEGLRRILEANPGGLGRGEDEALYRRRVEALEGLMRVLDAQPSSQWGSGRGAREEEMLGDMLEV